MRLLTRRGFLGAAGTFALAPGLFAQPKQSVEGPTVFETGSAHYELRSFRHPAPGGGADHVVRVAWPKGQVPPGGFPTVVALDGRAVAAALDEAALGRLAKAGGPAIVALGHDRPTRFASEERARDYTPPDADGRRVEDPRGRAGGGAGAFLDLVETELLPRAEALGPLDPGRRLLWGHSYGGLFVLHAALFGRADMRRFVAASPSLWWNHARFYDRCVAAIASAPPVTPLDLHSGGAERARASRPAAADAQGLIAMRDALPEGALGRLSAMLRGAGCPGETLEFAGLSHGETFTRSLRETLSAALRLTA